MHVLNNKEELFALLAKGTTVVTPNNRLSDSLIQNYFGACHSKTVDKPLCVPYGVALIKAYEQLNFSNPEVVHPTLLNTAQCQHLWRKIIKSHPDITYSEGLLNSVMSAWERCQLWHLSPDDPTFHYTPQTQQFQRWWHLFDAQLKKQHLITEYQLIPYLISTNGLLFSQPVVWVCFDDFTPQQQQLQTYLDANGLEQYQYDLKKRLTKPHIMAAQNDKEELNQLITWLQLKIADGNQRIGVVIPDLQQKSQAIQRILAQHFDSSLFNLSLGQPLSTYPLVAHALCWLNLDTLNLSHHQASLLLQSPYLGGAKDEFLARAQYQQDLVLLEEENISFKKLLQAVDKNTPTLAQLLSHIKPYPKEATLHEWIHLFQERLNNLGFPGDYGLHSANYQCLNRFTLLLDELRQLSVLSPRFTQSEALEALQCLTESTIFQAQKTNAPIQISGLLEASGCEFDCLWVAGLTDQCLPQKVHLSAFIPPQLQRDLSMPHSLPARELQFARQTLERLQNGADTVVFSYPQLQGDTPNLPCSLITGFPTIELVPIVFPSSQGTELLSVEDHYDVPIRPEESISGGTALLANQAKCPFKAFSEHRLRAKTLLQTVDGIDPRTRGQIIHKVMELLWRTLGSQKALFELEPETLDQHIGEAIDAALASLNDSVSHFIHEVECIRLKRLVLACLEWEKQRTAFTIEALEQMYTINLAGIDFKVRIDRLDQVADKKWVIDYKSSLPGSRPWNEDRPKEPQLLLYALLDSQINALLFMQLKTGNISCSGFSEEKQRINGISSLKKEETWEDYRGSWQEQLTVLATEFQQGYCPPKPAQLALCQQCDYQNLCRIQSHE